MREIVPLFVPFTYIYSDSFSVLHTLSFIFYSSFFNLQESSRPQYIIHIAHIPGT